GIFFRHLRVKLEGSLGVALALQAASVDVELNGSGLIKRLSEHFVGFVVAVHGFEDARLGFEILEALFRLNGLISPLQRLFQFVVVVETPVGGFFEASPRKATYVAKFILDTAKDDGLDVDADADGNGSLVPAEGGVGRLRLGVVKGVS